MEVSALQRLLLTEFDQKTSNLGRNLCPLYRECLLYGVSVLERFLCIRIFSTRFDHNSFSGTCIIKVGIGIEKILNLEGRSLYIIDKEAITYKDLVFEFDKDIKFVQIGSKGAFVLDPLRCFEVVARGIYTPYLGAIWINVKHFQSFQISQI